MKFSEKWSMVQASLFILIAIAAVWGIAYLISFLIPIGQDPRMLSPLWKLIWILFAAYIVSKRGGSRNEILGYAVLAWASTALSILTVVLLWWMLVYYEKGVMIFPIKKRKATTEKKIDT